LFDVERWNLPRKAAIGTDDEAAVWLQELAPQPGEIGTEVRERHDVGEAVDVPEAVGWRPRPGISHVEVGSELWKALPGNLDELGTEVESEWNEGKSPLCPPGSETLEQKAVRTSEIQQRPIGLDRVEDWFSLRAPPGRATSKTGLESRIGALEIAACQPTDVGKEVGREFFVLHEAAV